MTLNVILLGAILSFFLAVGEVRAEAKNCSYELDKNSVSVGWSAFKTSQKVAVKGSFKKLDIRGGSKGKNLSVLLRGLDITVDKLSADTGNPARDKTLAEYFFSHLHKTISGRIKNFSEEENSFVLTLNFNGQKKDVPMHFEFGDDNLFQANGQIDLSEFAADSALNSLHEQCKELHKGSDGVSKTWSEVALNLGAKIQKHCK